MPSEANPPKDLSALTNELEALALDASPTAVRRLLEGAFAALGPRQAVLTTGLGMEGCALLDLVAPLDLPLRVVFLDTGFHFDETLELYGRLRQRYRQLDFETVGPGQTPAEQAASEGPELWSRQPDRCCQLRKIEPLARRLRGTDLWVSALTRSQSATRAGQPVLSPTSRFGVAKLSPLAAWSRREVWQYVQARDVPFNALHEEGYPSISCRHCTLPVPGLAPGEYSRAGRWSTTAKTECGLHTLTSEATSASRTSAAKTSASTASDSTASDSTASNSTASNSTSPPPKRSLP